MNVPENLRYAESHEWILVEGDTGTVGITDHAQAELTDIVFAEPPPVGKKLSAGEVAAVVESVKAASSINMPLDGEVVEVNSALDATPELVNDAPLGDGWFFRFVPADAGQLDTLLDQLAYDNLISAQG